MSSTLKSDFIIYLEKIGNIMSSYTKDIISHIDKDITSCIKKYIDNYKVGYTTKLSIKIPIDENIIKIVENIDEPDLYELTKYFNFRTLKYHNNKKVILSTKNLQNYIQYFLPHWNECIKEHYIIIGKNNYYYLEINFSIGINININEPGTIIMKHDDHMNQIYYEYIKNELDNCVKYIIDQINTKIKKNIVSDNKHYINIIEYLGNEQRFVNIFSSNSYRDIWNYIYFKQQNMINILKLNNIPTSFKLFDYIYIIIKFIRYFYFQIKKYYKSQNIKIVQIPNLPDIILVNNKRVCFVSLCIKL